MLPRSRRHHRRSPRPLFWLSVALLLIAACADPRTGLASATCRDLEHLTEEQAVLRVAQVLAESGSLESAAALLREMKRLCPEVVPSLRRPIPLDSVGITAEVTECSDGGAAGVVTSKDQRVLDLTFRIAYTTDDGSVVATEEGLTAMGLAPGVSRAWRSTFPGARPSHTHCEFVLTEAYQGCC